MHTPIIVISKFVGRVVTGWNRNGRDMSLLEEFAYLDSNGNTWLAPIGSVVDGASIPRIFWSTISSPFCGKYRRASIIHDVFCKNKKIPHKKVHAMFYEAMLTDGVPPFKAKLMFHAVNLFGPKW